MLFQLVRADKIDKAGGEQVEGYFSYWDQGDSCLPIFTSPESLFGGLKVCAATSPEANLVGFEEIDPFELVEVQEPSKRMASNIWYPLPDGSRRESVEHRLVHSGRRVPRCHRRDTSRVREAECGGRGKVPFDFPSSERTLRAVAPRRRQGHSRRPPRPNCGVALPRRPLATEVDRRGRKLEPVSTNHGGQAPLDALSAIAITPFRTS